MPDTSNASPSEQTSAFLSLPAELRNKIYSFIAINDIEIFVDKQTQPALLNTSHQLRHEYTDIFFGGGSLQIDAYHGFDNAWQQVERKYAQRLIFEAAVFTTIVDFWSLASARRYCQRMYSDWQGNVQTGILTVRTWAGLRRWQWSVPVG